jgi:CRISPR/Cas system-associated exonuclease Cas4 (RecB family)
MLDLLRSDPRLAVGAVVALLLGAAFLLLLLSRWLAGHTGMPGDAEILASDTGQNRVEKIHDPETRLVGQPDYVLRERVGFRRRLVPAELKPSRRGDTLHESDEMQVTVYMLLMRHAYGREFAGYGYVRYKEKTFRVDLTREREARCLAIADAVREARRVANTRRNHDQRGRCAQCSYVSVCEDRLT